MEDDNVQRCLDAAQKFFNEKEFSVAEDFIQTALDWTSNDEKRAEIEDLLTHYKKEISKVKSNYHGDHHSNVSNKSNKDEDVEELLVTNEAEYRLLGNSLLMRKMVYQMGVKVFALKADNRTDVDFKEVECQINDLIKMSELEFDENRFSYAEKYMKDADDVYSAATKNIVMHQQKLKNNESETDTKKDSKKHIGNSDTDSTLKSYKVTVIGDNVDLIKCLKVAENALLAKDFKKAERWLQKSERIQPNNDYTKQLNRKLELAKREALESEIKSVPTEITEQAEEVKEETELKMDKDTEESKKVTTNEQKAEVFLNKCIKAINDGNKEKAQRFISRAQRIFPEVDTKDIEYQMKNCQHNTDEKKQADNPLPEKNICESKELDSNFSSDHLQVKSNTKESHIKTDHLKIPVPNYLESNSETAFEHRVDDKYKFYTSKNPMDTLEKYLKKGRTALTRSNIENAKSFASKALDLFPESPRVKALIDDIQETEKLNRHVGSTHSSNDFTPKKQTWSNITTQTDRESLKKAAQDCLREAVKEFVAGNYDKAEEIIQKTEKLYPLPELNPLSQKIQAERFKKQSEKRSNTSCDPTEPPFNKGKNNSLKDAHIKSDCNERQSVSLEQQAEQCIDDARREISLGNLNKAEQILHKVKKLNLGVDEEANKLLKRIESHRFRAQSEKYDNGNVNTSNPHEHTDKVNANKDQLNECIHNARKAFYEHDMDKADRLCQKAIRMGSNTENDEVNKLISEIREEKEKRKVEVEKPVEPTNNMDEESVDDNVKLDVDKCYDLAEQAFNERNFVKAERLLQKAIRMSKPHVPAHFDGFLCKVQTEIKKTTERAEKSEKSENYKASGEPSGESEKEKVVEELINKALDSMEEKHYYVAELWLKRAESLYPTNQAKDLLENIHKKIKSDIASFRNKSTKDDLRQKSEFQKSSGTYLTEAQNMFESGDYDGARRKALISDSFEPNARAKELLQHIIHKQYENAPGKSEAPGKIKSCKNKKGQRAPVPDKLFRADKILEMATEALRFGDLRKAYDLVKESNELNASVKARKMLIEIKELQRESKDSLFTRVVKGIRSYL